MYNGSTEVDPFSSNWAWGKIQLDADFSDLSENKRLAVIAHEMGHAMHSYMSTKYQAPLDRHYKIFVAEVASTCNEALLMDYLRKQNSDSKFQAYLINHFMEQFRTTLFRQCMFAEFEKIINEKTANNEVLTSDTLNQIYADLNKFYYGEDVIVDDEISMEWARIPHFYMNFYVYQYATGFSAAMALSQKLLHGTQADIEAYLSFLKVRMYKVSSRIIAYGWG